MLQFLHDKFPKARYEVLATFHSDPKCDPKYDPKCDPNREPDPDPNCDPNPNCEPDRLVLLGCSIGASHVVNWVARHPVKAEAYNVAALVP